MVFAVTLIAVALAAHPLKSPKEEGASKPHSAQSATNPKDASKSQQPSQPPTPSLATAPTAASEPAAQTSESSTDSAAENVKVQRWIEIFTGVLAFVGVTQTIITVLVLLVYHRQAREMRRQRHVMYRQWKAMREQLGQMKSAGRQTDQLIETMRDTAMRELRAYVCMSQAMIEFRQERAPEVQVHIKNCGKTPAYDVEMWIGVGLGQYPGPLTLPLPPEGFKKSKSLLAPGEKPHAMVFRHSVIPEEQMPIFGTPELTMFVYGEITYRDAFGKQRITKYRLMYGGAEPMRLRDKGSGVAVGFLKPDTIGNEAN